MQKKFLGDYREDNSIKVLISSDWHLDAITAGVVRLQDIDATLYELGRAIMKEQPDLFIFAGDLSNPDKGARTIKAMTRAAKFAEFLSTIKCPGMWIAGNHDVIESTDAVSTLDPISAIEWQEVFKEPSVELFHKKMAVVLIPYVSKYRRELFDPDELQKKVDDLGTFPVLVVGHCTNVEGAMIRKEDYTIRGGSMKFPMLRANHGQEMIMVNGHYHRAQTTKKGVHIPGSIARLTFGEAENDPGYLLVEFKKNLGSKKRSRGRGRVKRSECENI